MGSGKLKKKQDESGIVRLLREHARGLLGLLVVVLVVHDIFGPHGFLAMRRTQDEMHRVKASLERLNKENAQLEQEVKDLKTDPKLIEKIARDDLGLAKPGEIIIKIPQALQPDAPAKP